MRSTDGGLSGKSSQRKGDGSSTPASGSGSGSGSQTKVRKLQDDWRRGASPLIGGNTTAANRSVTDNWRRQGAESKGPTKRTTDTGEGRSSGLWQQPWQTPKAPAATSSQDATSSQLPAPRHSLSATMPNSPTERTSPLHMQAWVSSANNVKDIFRDHIYLAAAIWPSQKILVRFLKTNTSDTPLSDARYDEILKTEPVIHKMKDWTGGWSADPDTSVPKFTRSSLRPASEVDTVADASTAHSTSSGAQGDAPAKSWSKAAGKIGRR